MHQSSREKLVQLAENQLLHNRLDESLGMCATAGDHEIRSGQASADEQLKSMPRRPFR